MRNLLKQSKVQLILTLLPILLLSLLNGYPISQTVNPAVIIFSAVFFDLLFLSLRRVKLFFPSAAIATGIILSLIIDPFAPFYVLIAAPFAAIFSKNFIRMGRHIFNPAAFGALTIAILFSSQASWWGPSIYLGSPLYLLVFLPGLVSFYRMRRWRIISAFLLSYLILGTIFNLQFSIYNLFDPTLIFFSLVMLPEPMTTPNHPKRQILFGAFVALITFVLPQLFQVSNLQFSMNIDPLILSLLLGNLLFFKFR
ncbi:MAG: RnfABCDGE type electron transport complex subunit D [Patescibacteria group bacterium]